MKALMLTHTYHPSIGGGIRYKTAVVDHLRGLGHTVDVLAVSTDRSMSLASTDRGAVLRVPTWVEMGSSAIAPSYITHFGKLAPQYDALHFNFPSPMAELALVAHRRSVRKARKIVMYHGDIVPAKRLSGPYNRWVTAPFLDEMDAIIVSSPKVLDSSPHLQRLRDKVHVIPFGLDATKFSRPAGAEKSGRNGGELQLLFVGRLSRYKGVDHLLEALVGGPGRLSIVGDGPLRSTLESQRDALGLEGRVAFLGTVGDEELLELYHRADVLVLPSIDPAEAFGYVLMEAMLCRCAAVSTELGTGTSFVNVDRESGFVVPPRDPGAIREALRSLDTNRKLLRTLQDNALARMLSSFTLERMLSQTEALYA